MRPIKRDYSITNKLVFKRPNVSQHDLVSAQNHTKDMALPVRKVIMGFA